jgi:hypothetical protein
LIAGATGRTLTPPYDAGDGSPGRCPDEAFAGRHREMVMVRGWMCLVVAGLLAPGNVSAEPRLGAGDSWVAHAFARVLPALRFNFIGSRDGTVRGDAQLVRALDATQGWQRLGFGVGERANGIYLAVDGRASFGRAEVVFTDGEMETVELNHATRSNGVYELLDFGADREVMVVRLLARAESDRASVSVLLGRAPVAVSIGLSPALD